MSFGDVALCRSLMQHWVALDASTYWWHLLDSVSEKDRMRLGRQCGGNLGEVGGEEWWVEFIKTHCAWFSFISIES